MTRADVALGEGDFRAAIDNLARNGRLEGVRMFLLKYQLRPTVNTLEQAIKNGNRQLVYCLIDMGADPLGRNEDIRASPYLEALQARDVELIQYLEDRGAIAALGNGQSFVLAWEAAIKAGYEETLQKMIRRMQLPKKDPWPLSLVTISLNHRREDLASILLSANEAGYIPFRAQFHVPSAGKVVDAAFRTGCPDIIEALLKRGIEGADAISVINAAIKWGDSTLCEQMFHSVRAPPGTHLKLHFDAQGALYKAVKSRNRQMVNLLLDHYGPPPPGISRSGLTAAAENRDHDMALHLLSRGADPNDSGALLAAVTEQTEWHVPYSYDDDDVARFKRMRSNRDKKCPPYTTFPVDMAMVKLLVTHFFKKYPRGVKTYGLSALLSAIRAGKMEIIDYLISNKIDISPAGHIVPTVRGQEGILTTAIQSCCGNQLDILEKLLRAGVDPNCNFTTYTGFHNGMTGLRETPLLQAISTRSIPMLKLLIEHGASINFPATRGITRTPLQKAAEVGDMDIVQFLLDCGADINSPPGFPVGGTAIQLAAMSGWAGIVDLLLRKGAHVNAPGARVQGRTALEAAAEHGRLDTIQVLINAGAGTGDGGPEQVKRALKFASKNGHIGVCELLEGHFREDVYQAEDSCSEGDSSSEEDSGSEGFTSEQGEMYF